MLINIIHTLLVLFVTNLMVYRGSDDGSKLEKVNKWINVILMFALIVTTLTHIWIR